VLHEATIVADGQVVAEHAADARAEREGAR